MEQSFRCVAAAWQAYERDLIQFLIHQTGQNSQAQDLLQEVFLKAMKQGTKFCALENPRAWLFQVARTTLIDHNRRSAPWYELPEDLPESLPDKPAPVVELDQCIARNIPRLSEQDRCIIECCDLHGQTVKLFAEQHHLSLAAAKSRLLRARQKLRTALIQNCGVRFDEQGQVCCHIGNEKS